MTGEKKVYMKNEDTRYSENRRKTYNNYYYYWREIKY